MSDTIERLRKAAKTGLDPSPFDTLTHEAADAIEAKDAEIAALRKHNSNMRAEITESKIRTDTLREQVRVLREALVYHQEQTRPIQRTIDALAATKEQT